MKGFADSLTYAALVVINGRRIDAAVAMGDSSFYCAHELGTFLNFEYSDAEPRHRLSIV
ncbi:hypothetical protein D3C75_1296580 [compost metagenome]